MTDHLHPKARAMLDQPAQIRFGQYWDDVWIHHARVAELYDEMIALRDAPPRHRPRSMLIYGPIFNGKSKLLIEFARENSPYQDPSKDYLQFPVLKIEMPSKPDEGRLWSEILKALSLTYRLKESSALMEELAMRALTAAGVKVLLIDELHNALNGGYAQQRWLMTILKRFTNVTQVPIVAAGTDAALTAINYDKQLASRFRREPLPDWQLNEDFLRLLDSFEERLPLRNPSNLSDDALAIEMHSMCRGMIGHLSEILRVAAFAAIEDKSERITLKTLRHCKWKPQEEEN